MAERPPDIGKGDVITASWLNAVKNAVVQSIKGGRGINAKRVGNDVLLELVQSQIIPNQRPLKKRWMWITAHKLESPNKWRYAGYEVRPGETIGSWVEVENGAVADLDDKPLMNSVEANNTATGIQGNGENVDEYATGTVLLPARGDPVVEFSEVSGAMGSVGVPWYDFHYENHSGPDGPYYLLQKCTGGDQIVIRALDIYSVGDVLLVSVNGARPTCWTVVSESTSAVQSADVYGVLGSCADPSCAEGTDSDPDDQGTVPCVCDATVSAKNTYTLTAGPPGTGFKHGANSADNFLTGCIDAPGGNDFPVNVADVWSGVFDVVVGGCVWHSTTNKYSFGGYAFGSFVHVGYVYLSLEIISTTPCLARWVVEMQFDTSGGGSAVWRGYKTGGSTPVGRYRAACQAFMVPLFVDVA